MSEHQPSATGASTPRKAAAAALYVAEMGAFLALSPAAYYATFVTITYGGLEDVVNGAIRRLAARVNAEDTTTPEPVADVAA
jgi:hypothetical protein